MSPEARALFWKDMMIAAVAAVAVTAPVKAVPVRRLRLVHLAESPTVRCRRAVDAERASTTPDAIAAIWIKARCANCGKCADMRT